MKHTLDGTDKEEAFVKTYEAYVDDIYRLCFSFLKNQMDAEDAVQETFIKYYHLEKDFEKEVGKKAWLIVTASNQCKDMLKHWWRKRKDITDYEEQICSKRQEMDEMMELILQLPEKYKTAVYCYYYEGYNSREIAKILHKPESTIRTYLQKARKLLKQEMQQEGEYYARKNKGFV